MVFLRKTVIAAAALAALSGGVAHAQSANDVQALHGTVEDLRKQLEELRNLLQQRGIDTTPVAASVEESQEAQDARTAATKADIQGLRADLENYKYDQSRLQERNIPSVTRNTKIGGSLTVRWDALTQSKTQAPDATTATGSVPTDVRYKGFSAISAGLNFTGNLFRDYAEGRNLTYRLALSGVNDAATNRSTLNLTDAYLRYSFLPASGNAEDPLGTITLGQQIVPFGLDAQAIDPEVKAVIGNAGFVSGLGVGTRQVGLVLSGDFDPYVDFTNNYRAPLLAYSLGFFNGNGPNRVDNNNSVDYIGRLVYTLPVDYSSWFRQLQIGTSYYNGNASLATTGDSTYATTTTKGKNDRYGFDVNWTHLPYSVSYEWAKGKKDLFRNSANLATNPDLVQVGKGQYINFGYTWGEQFLNSSKQQGKYDDFWPKSYQAFVRFDEWDPNTSVLVQNDKQFVTTIGLNVFFAETTKFQINYLRTRNQLRPETAAKPANSDAIQALFNAQF